MVHGVALLFGAVMVMLGFVAGVMYLVQSYRLKRKLPSRQGFRLPSLEWLQRVNKQSLYYSAFFIAIGWAAGILLNLIKGSFPWTDLVVVTSSVLLLWLAAALLFEYFYKPAGQGRKVAYMTVASFIFLGLVLGFVLCTKHVSSSWPGNSASVQESSAGNSRELRGRPADVNHGRLGLDDQGVQAKPTRGRGLNPAPVSTTGGPR
jgi:hypothetical protein